MFDPDYVGDNVSPEHRSKFKSNLWIWILVFIVGITAVAAMTLNIIGDKPWLA